MHANIIAKLFKQVSYDFKILKCTRYRLSNILIMQNINVSLSDERQTKLRQTTVSLQNTYGIPFIR